MIMKSETFEKLRFLAEVGIPALATLVLAVSNIWNLPYGQQIGTTIVAIGTFIGALVGINFYQKRSGKSAGSEDDDDEI